MIWGKASALLPTHIPYTSYTQEDITAVLQLHNRNTLFRRFLEITILLFGVVLVLYFTLAPSISIPHSLKHPLDTVHLSSFSAQPSGDPVWPADGWDGIRTIIAFGDSHSDTGFDPKGTQPNHINPFGNPSWLQRPETGLSAGTTWLYFLASQYRTAAQASSIESYLPSENKTLTIPGNLRLYNLALAGSFIDPSLLPPTGSTSTSKIPSLQHQLDIFRTLYGADPASIPWTPSTTLITLALGTHDLLLPSTTLTYPPIPKLLRSLRSSLRTLYNLSARNFLLLDIPPIHLANPTAPHSTFLASLIANYNHQLREAVHEFRRYHPDATVFLLSTSALWEELSEATSSLEATRDVLVTEGACVEYARPGAFPHAFSTAQGGVGGVRAAGLLGKGPEGLGTRGETLGNMRVGVPDTDIYGESVEGLGQEHGGEDAREGANAARDKRTPRAGTSSLSLPPDYYDKRCGVDVSKYFWLDMMHATFAVHNATAGVVVEECFGGAVDGERRGTGFCGG